MVVRVSSRVDNFIVHILLPTLVLREHGRLRGFGTKLFDAANFTYTFYVFPGFAPLFVRVACMTSKSSPRPKLLYNNRSDFVVHAFALLKIEAYTDRNPRGLSAVPIVSRLPAHRLQYNTHQNVDSHRQFTR
jgi:hypothetical protein